MYFKLFKTLGSVEVGINAQSDEEIETGEVAEVIPTHC
jgi:hypothetical protein